VNGLRRVPFGGRVAYGVLGLVVVIALLLGSHHTGVPTDAERVAHLESIIKCPDCTDLTIAQSSSEEAVGLQQQVATRVAEGESDAEIEAYVVNIYGSDEILTPSGLSGAFAIGLPIALFLVAASVIVVTLVRRGRRDGPDGPDIDPEDLAIVSAALGERGIEP
jgi:cytochrome c-type biogenesis protein CcmH/NrfF